MGPAEPRQKMSIEPYIHTKRPTKRPSLKRRKIRDLFGADRDTFGVPDVANLQ